MSLLVRAFGNSVPGAPPGPLGLKSLGVVGGGGEPQQGYLSKILDYFASKSNLCVRTTSVRSQKISYSRVQENIGPHLL